MKTELLNYINDYGELRYKCGYTVVKIKMKTELLNYINDYGELKYKCGYTTDTREYIDYQNQSEEVFNKIVDLIDSMDINAVIQQ